MAAPEVDDPAIQATPTPHPTTGHDVEDDEKKVVLAEIASIYSEPAPARREPPWLAFLKSLVGVEPARGTPIYRHRGSVPTESDAKSAKARIWKFFKFLGPGAIISVAYVDPDNYQTAISSGASFQFKLLFMVLFSNIIGIYIQSLCVKLGTVTGMDLAQMNHRYLPRWLELALYVVAEASIIATDLGQVIGTAIALNILIPGLPLPAACVVSVADTLLILLFYTPAGELRRIRLFEIFIALLVSALFITLCVALSMVTAPPRDVFRGFVPSSEVFVATGLYEMCAILGGTLMPHALYVGTALSRARLYDFDAKHSLVPLGSPASSSSSLAYRPSLRAIKSCLKWSIAELATTLFIVAVFVNSALLIISGAAFYRVEPPDSGSGTGSGDDGSAGGDLDKRDPGDVVDISDDLYDLYNLFATSISPAAGTLFAVSLLFSGITAGIVSTMAGQIVMEGALNLRISPFLRRLITRCVAIIPALVIAVSVGQAGLSRALVACNYLLAIALIPITFPLIYYTGRSRMMQVPSDDGTGSANMKNHIVVALIAWLLWLLVVVMDIATVVLAGLGVTDAD
ncbi:natural resistance-associated macrophage protein-domain-containing protein [Lasiosphaeria ovina]|uniref:Natural resistance-associated macrophage protein-domain-containing protein n=1 Tax=Lasiosphaeria ovina TaxID=92902 RepID=A0AAE0N5X8_9PEZI|nr:natural resistance-associated macrophage protein-domain-containing protein [Lasiosphaeria ovina]